MSCSRALVSCAILSLQDTCFVYPYCKCCLSRLTQKTSARATCARCGFTCDLQNVDYRYRLSMTVSRNQDIFGVTVFGGCLNPFFGITAGGLQRFIELERPDGTHTVQQLLTKAVEDCFIGRCVVLGLKGSCDDVKTWSADQQTSSLILKSKQLVACQMISPSEAFAKSTVIGYLKHLLQSNSYSCDSESANGSISLPQQIHSHSLERDESSSFEHTLPSCARLNSQASSEDFTLSAWQSPGLCFTHEEIKHHSLQSPKNEDNRTCQRSVEFSTDECFWSCPLDQLKHDDIQDKTQNSYRKSFSSSCDMFKSSVHFNSCTTCDSVYPSKAFSCGNDSKVTSSCQCVLKLKSGDKNNAAYFDKSILSLSEQNLCLDLQDAPLSEDLLDFVKAEPQTSEIIDAKHQCNSGKNNGITQDQKRCSLIENDTLKTAVQSDENSTFSLMSNVNNTSCKQKNENHCPENPQSFSGRKNKMILADLNMNVSPNVVHVFHLPKNNRLCFSNRKDLTLQRKTLTRNKLSVALCSPNHEQGKYFRQSEVQSVNCKVKQEYNVCDDHQDMYNCSVDLFACLDMNQSDVTEFSKANELSNVNTSEPGVLGSKHFSPCLQSTPVSYQQKLRWSHKRVNSLCNKELKLKFTSEITDLRENRLNKPKVTMSELNRLQNVDSIERFSDESNVKCVSLDSSVNVNEWSRDLFDSF